VRPITDPNEVVRCLGLPHDKKLPTLATDIARNRVLLEGHFELQSGRHSGLFVRFAGLGWDDQVMARLVPVLVESAGRRPGERLTVLAPESAGLLLGRAVAEHLGAELAVAAIDHQRRPLSALRHGRIPAGGRILVTNDVITTGRSLEALLSFPNTELVGLLSFAALSTDPVRAIEKRYGVHPQWLVTGTWSTFDPSSCPQCASNSEPVVPAGEFN
jgi:orotate phosphoribosyltransferase